MIDAKTKNAIVEVLKKYPVKLAYLYGSYAKGFERPDSDIDIAVVPRENSEINPFRIAADVDSAVSGKEVDVRVISPGGSPLFEFNTIRYAQPIYVLDESDRIAFEVATARRYYDTEKIRRIRYHYLVKTLKGGSYGHRPRYNPVFA